MKILAAAVNRNTCAYMELMLRSLFTNHNLGEELALTIFDNDSRDNNEKFQSYARQVNVPILPSGFALRTENDSRGEILRRFVLEQPDCTHYLFMDADICFTQPDTINSMLAELDSQPQRFGISPRLSWDGQTESAECDPCDELDIAEPQLHPCCALIKNTPVFRRVVDEVGLSAYKVQWSGGDEYLEPFLLMTRVMRTHGLYPARSSQLIIHFSSTSNRWHTEPIELSRSNHRDRLLAHFRSLGKKSNKPGSPGWDDKITKLDV